MYTLEKRALIGDRGAQLECTEKGIVLRCPFCGGEAELKHTETPTCFSEIIDRFFVACKECGCGPFGFSGYNLFYTKEGIEKANELKKKALERWNTRPAPPSIIKKCSICKYYLKDEECCNGFCELKPGPVFEPDDYCNEFESKED